MRTISKVLVIIGTVLILVPIIGHFYLGYKQEQLYIDYRQTIEKDSEQVGKKQVDENTWPQKEEDALEAQEVVAEQGEVIGKIKIDKIDVDLIVVEGTSDAELGIGVGHMKDTAYPGCVGNCAIAGHRNYTFGSMFNRLDEVEVGDEVELEFWGQEYTYKVEEVKIVAPEEISVLEQDKSKKYLTLITCHPLYTGTHRLIITGSLEE